MNQYTFSLHLLCLKAKYLVFDELPETTQEKADTHQLMLNINITKLGKTPAIQPGIHAPAVSEKILTTRQQR